MIYMDYNATTPCDKRVVDEMLPYFFDEFSNPSSLYGSAQTSSKALAGARDSLAKLIGCLPSEIYFTSGGTEADNWAIKATAIAMRDKGRHIITSSVEHHAVLNVCKYLEKSGYEITYLPVDKFGVVDLQKLVESVRQDTVLITIMYANNEIGTIQPVADIARIAVEKGVYFHTDAVQAVGKIPLSVKQLGVDMLSVSAHKFYGPKGVGALYIRKGTKTGRFFHGGGQERGMRAGTENVPGIVGMGRAAELASVDMDSEYLRVKGLRDRMEKAVKEAIPEVLINGHPEQRLYNTLSICVKYVEGESMLLSLDFEGICASSGSACTSGSLEPSHVLLATGLPAGDAHGSLRLSLGKYSTESDVEKLVDILAATVEKLRKMSPFGKK